MKKTISILLTFVLVFFVFSSFAFTSFAETVTGDCGSDAHWSYDTQTKTLTISGTGSTADYLGPDPSVPEFYYRAKPWDPYVGEIESVVVEEGITRIGDAVLMNYPAATSVTLPGTLVELGKNNILGFDVLTSLTLPEGLEVIGASSVSGCYHLGEIYIPATLREVHWCALMYLNNLLDPENPEEQNDLNIYYSGTEEQWNAVDFCEADYAQGGGINWTRIWLLSGNYINLVMHYNWRPAPPVKRGDTNSDGVINLRDLMPLKQYLASMPTEINLVNADVNEDKAINARDVSALKQLIAGVTP